MCNNNGIKFVCVQHSDALGVTDQSIRIVSDDVIDHNVPMKILPMATTVLIEKMA